MDMICRSDKKIPVFSGSRKCAFQEECPNGLTVREGAFVSPILLSLDCDRHGVQKDASNLGWVQSADIVS